MMEDFSELRVGDKLHRIIRWSDRTTTTFDAVVSELTSTTIVCLVTVDQLRRMEFDRTTGIHTDGVELGWLQFEEGVASAPEGKMERRHRLQAERLEEEVSNLQNLVTKLKGEIEGLKVRIELRDNWLHQYREREDEYLRRL